MAVSFCFCFFFFFNDTATTEIYTLSLHDALPISSGRWCGSMAGSATYWRRACTPTDRKSTRLNSSHPSISYAVFCLKKKKKHRRHCFHPDHRQPCLRAPVPDAGQGQKQPLFFFTHTATTEIYTLSLHDALPI